MSLRIRASGNLTVATAQKQINMALSEALTNYIRRMSRYVDTSTLIPKASGRLKQSAMEVMSESYVSGTRFSFAFGFAVPYAKAADTGRAAGRPPPIDAITFWAKYKGLPKQSILPIVWAIAKHGTRGAHYWNTSVNYAVTVIMEELMTALHRHGFEVR